MQVIGSSAINWGFTPQDILQNSMNVFSTLLPFILLSITFAFVPRFFRLIRGAVGIGKKQHEDEDDEE